MNKGENTLKMKKLRILQMINLWILLPAYICTFTCSKSISSMITDELYYWKRCDQRIENSRFDIFPC